MPFKAGIQTTLTQDCQDSCCNDHVAQHGFAYDFSNGKNFPIVAARDGTVVHLKQSSKKGGVGTAFIPYANYIVIDHGDGTMALYWHLEPGSIAPDVTCNQFVRRGQRLARAGSTGFSTGVHLHFQVGVLRPDKVGICECGSDGNDCTDDAFEARNYIATSTYPTVPVILGDWPESAECSDRRIKLTSENVDGLEPVVTIDDADPAFAFAVGSGTPRAKGGYGQAFRSAEAVAAGAASVVGRYAVGSRVATGGVYEVLAFVPFSKHANASNIPVVLTARGGQYKGTFDQSVLGGAFHRVEGLGRVKLIGREAERLDIGNDTGSPGDAVGYDAIVLHRVADAGPGELGASCEDATSCVGDLVCVDGVCTEGCEASGCACDEVCEGTGVCTPGLDKCEGEVGGTTGGGTMDSTSSATLNGGGDCHCRIGGPSGGRTLGAWIPGAFVALLLARRVRTSVGPRR